MAMAVLSLGTLLPRPALGHPSGLPVLKERVDLLWSDAGTWLLWDFHESIVIGCVVLGLLYGLAVTVWRAPLGMTPKTPEEKSTLHSQIALFYGNLGILYLSLDGPLHHLADELLFSAHMLQHMLLQLLWAPLLVVSVPRALWRAIVRPVLPLARWATRPTVAFLLFNGVVFGWHIPQLYNVALTIHAWHIVQHLMFMSTAVIMWFVVIAPLPELSSTYAKRMTFVLVNMLSMKLLGVIISLADDVLYTFYLSQPRAWGIDAMSDQQLGGMLMWLPGGGVLWAGLGRIFWQWVRTGTPPRGQSGIPELDRARAERNQRRRDAEAAVEPVAAA